MGFVVYLEVVEAARCSGCGKQYGYLSIGSSKDISKPYALCDVINKFKKAGKIFESFDRMVMDKETFWKIRWEYALSFLKNPEIAERYQHKPILKTFETIDKWLKGHDKYKIAYHST